MSKPLEIPELSDAEKQRFWDKVEKRQDGCWIWTGETSVGTHGGLRYGQFRIGAHRYAAHRVSWHIFHGAIPDGLQTDHRCHNTLCVNPSHLHLVDQVRNTENRAGANRMANDCKHSGFRGVTWNKRNRKWIVQVTHLRKNYYGGSYTDVNEANRAAIALRNRLMSNNLADR